jgi:hypothetical protein
VPPIYLQHTHQIHVYLPAARDAEVAKDGIEGATTEDKLPLVEVADFGGEARRRPHAAKDFDV